jgi:hypothetical protein
MLTHLILFAAQTTADLQQQLPAQKASKLFGLSMRDLLLLLGLLGIIALGLYLFVYLTRRKHRRHLSRSGQDMWRSERRAQREKQKESESGRTRVRIRKKRREHPDFRPRNPTLGETGGLPPVRPDEPAQPAT